MQHRELHYKIISGIRNKFKDCWYHKQLLLLLLITLLAGCTAVPSANEAFVKNVVDGDTIKVILGGKTETVRLIGIDTPETVHPSKPVEPYGPEAAAYTRGNLSNRTIWLTFDVQERDRYGRLLAYVWLEKPGDEGLTSARHMFNAQLLLEGYAQVSTYPPNVRYTNYFISFQEEARNASRGMWSEVAPNRETTVYITKSGTRYHNDGCSYLTDNKIPLSFNEAQAKGYQPCSKCNPPNK